MKRPAIAITLFFFLGISCAAMVRPGFAENLTVRVSGTAEIKAGDIAGAQSEAIETALTRGLETVLIRMISPRAFEGLEPLLRAKVLPRVQDFVTNYQIVNRDVSDLAYTIGLSVTVDQDLLKEDLAKLGVIKEPDSPPLTVVFVTIDVPLDLEHVRTLGSLATESVASVLELTGYTVLPAPEEEELAFRLVRPPQTAQVLASGGNLVFADLSIGVLFRKTGQASSISQRETVIPMEVSLQAADVRTGALIQTLAREERVVIGSENGAILSEDLGGILSWMAQNLSQGLKDRYLIPREEARPVELVFEGSHDARDVRIALGEMLFRLGENAEVVPVMYTRGRSVYMVWSEKGKEGISRSLTSSKIVGEIFSVSHEGEGLILREKAGMRGGGVREFGQEVTFYRRLPVAGVENPDDVRKTETVSWQEIEDNSGVRSANLTPVGAGVLGRIDPQRDQDFFRILLPEGTRQVAVQVEQAGPGEVRPRVRVFDGKGNLLEDRKARDRGRNLFFTFPLPRATGEILVCLEDHLGRYPSIFPYVLKVTTGEGEGSGEPP